MPAPLDPAKRQAIEQAIRDGHTRNRIARDHGVAGSTVGNIAKQLEAQGDLDSPAFDRSATKTATAARSADLAGRRADLAVRLMDRAFELEQRLDEERVVGWSGTGEDRVPIREKPGGRDTQGFMVSIGIAVDKIRVLTEAESGAAEAASLLSTLVGDIRGRRTTVVADAAE